MKRPAWICLVALFCALALTYAVLLALVRAPIAAIAAARRALTDDMQFAVQLLSKFWKDWT